MAARKERVCESCGTVSYVFGTAKRCIPCQKAEGTRIAIEGEIRDITENGYQIISGPNNGKFNKREYSLKTPCGHEWTIRSDNFRKLIANAKAKNLPMPCGTCGPKHRLTNALSAYIEKYGRDYDLKKWDDYRLLVRKLSDITYRQFKEEINPLNHRRGKKTWHLDHKHPIIACFKDGWSPEKAASKENLQMLLWSDNLMKSGKINVVESIS